MNFIKIVYYVLFSLSIAIGSKDAVADDLPPANHETKISHSLGISYGIRFQQHSKSEIAEGSGNYFQVLFFEDNGSGYFVHNEQNNFNIVVGDATSQGVEAVNGIGVFYPSPLSTSVHFLIASAQTYNPDASSISGDSSSITSSRSTSSMVELGCSWSTHGGPTKMQLGLSYRSQRFTQPITLINSEGASTMLRDKNNMNLLLEIQRVF